MGSPNSPLRVQNTAIGVSTSIARVQSSTVAAQSTTIGARNSTAGAPSTIDGVQNRKFSKTGEIASFCWGGFGLPGEAGAKLIQDSV
ncbi:MAG: hypothetical protein AABZ02_14935 [Bacteroidota bacterium]